MDLGAVRGEIVSRTLETLVSRTIPEAIDAGLLPPMHAGETMVARRSYLARLAGFGVKEELGDPDLSRRIGIAALVLYASDLRSKHEADRPLSALDQIAFLAVQQAEFLRGMVAAVPKMRLRSTKAAVAARRALGSAKRERVTSLAPKYASMSKRAAAFKIAAETSIDFEQARRVLMEHFPGDSWPPKLEDET